AFHALPPMNRKDGTPVNAVFGFTSMVMKLMEDLAPDYAIVVLDQARLTFRNDIYPEYKANRSEPPEELIPQFALIREATRALNLPVAEMEGFEADDLIATYARLGAEQGMEVVIVSSDKDLMQLVRPGVTMLDPMKQKRIARDEVLERFFVPPEKVVDVQALAGDSTDNVPGVPGIGVKTAAELINAYGSLEDLLARAGEIKQPKRRENLINHADMARLSLQLVQLRDDAPLPVELGETRFNPPEATTLRAFLEEQDFRRLLSRLDGAAPSGSSASGGSAGSVAPGDTPAPSAPVPDEAEADYHLITDADTLRAWVDEARSAGVVAIDSETTSLTASAALMVGISMAVAPGRSCYIPLRHGNAGDDQGGFDFSGDRPVQIDFDEAVAILKPLLADPAVLKVGHNLKYDAHVMARAINGGFSITPVDDTMCLSYVLDAGRQSSHKLDDLAEIHLGHSMIKYADVCGKGAKQIGFGELKPDEALDYAAEDADYTLRLWRMLKPRLASEAKSSVYERLERPLIAVIAAMEGEGIKVNRQALASMSGQFATRMAELETLIHGLAGESFNIGSPKQLGEILFDKMGLRGGKKSKTGAWSTSADVLDDLVAEGVEIAEKILEWRQISKLKSTYADALVESIHPDSGRVHTSFSMVGASTGRLSSSDPNLQNIPIRTPEGRQIRTAFVPEPGSVLISADYSQIELRLVAHVAGEDSMIRAFQEGMDIHAQTASEVFGVPLDAMTPETRRRAKAINFGIIYGISGFGLARQLAIPQGEARDYIRAYFERFPGIRGYMDDMKLKAREDGFVETLFGRRLYITGITASNPAQRGFAERQAINAPIQGTAADIIKLAMVQMPKTLAEAKSPARMLLQVHDELVFECPEEAAGDAVTLIRRVMEEAASPVLNLSVPLIAEANIGASWDEAH
ncbi:MAG TPA: DNA polymerase I, partial [Alphaproteobacteria bacterium]|nr:DNA polymerase I [Alphaproteobacteria bacterium]